MGDLFKRIGKPEALIGKIGDVIRSGQRLMVLTGAGISAESGIPTFRGPEGYWRVGSREYHPQEMATRQMFSERPEDVWGWYLYRRSVCRKAHPNPGHLSVTEMETLFPGRFSLVTQNVDGLHPRAGSSPENTHEIHGNIFRMRCSKECTPEVYSIPEEVPEKGKGEGVTDQDRRLLRCPRCHGPSRSHILWFDECYNEEYYHYNSVLSLAAKTGLLLVAGTSGSTSLPMRVAETVREQGGLILDINIEGNYFSRLAKASGGAFIEATCSKALPAIFSLLADAASV
jgi:NAD-dependent deacetylase